MRKRINYETSNNAIITLDPIEIFIYVIMIVCGRLRNPSNNFLLMYYTREFVSRYGFRKKKNNVRSPSSIMRTKEAATQEVFFPSSYLAKSVYSFRASLPCLDDISSFSELNGSVK